MVLHGLDFSLEEMPVGHLRMVLQLLLDPPIGSLEVLCLEIEIDELIDGQGIVRREIQRLLKRPPASSDFFCCR